VLFGKGLKVLPLAHVTRIFLNLHFLHESHSSCLVPIHLCASTCLSATICPRAPT
jgi:hypothetical protein